uniref:NADH dehydrogenase subunit 6 n=1 Tax=Gergithoides gibbosus TaxID=3081102 RepID=UPI002E75E86B|nr:NADH dehydrogenase subunit 6 [Gergithoides gibbosus]WQB38501.1 NADH dehydrogenase subunit 6 [Gergithoides gibbosus]
MSKIMMMNVLITPFIKHPISLGSMLMMQTILISIKMFSLSNSAWFSYILFITIIGGMMVMFMYMASIASNEKFSPKVNLLTISTLMMITVMIMLPFTNMEYLEKKNELKIMTIQLEEIKSTSKFFNLNKMVLTIMTMMFLLLTMISVTNISNTFEGPLKKK